MKSIKLEAFNISNEIIINLKDLREKNHPEFEDFENLNFHINEAINQNGLVYHGKHIFNEIYELEKAIKPISFLHHMYYLAGNAKGVIKYQNKYSNSSFSRYRKHTYETVDILRKKIMLKHNGKIYEGYNGFQRIELIDSVNKLCQNIDSPKVLEVGCGSGINIYLLNALNPDIEIHGFEYTNSRIASAIVNLFYSSLCKNLFLASIIDLKLPDNSFDVVYSNHVLEQLGQENAEKALKEMWRVCRKGVVLSEPSEHGANIYEKWRLKKLGYCRDLYSVAKELPESKILTYKEDNYRTYPNTSHHLVIEKI